MGEGNQCAVLCDRFFLIIRVRDTAAEGEGNQDTYINSLANKNTNTRVRDIFFNKSVH
jgi:hypothetical protein